MRWQCKICGFRATTRGDLLQHYRLHHRTFEVGNSVPCLDYDCPCSFKTLSALRTHLSRYHAEDEANRPGVVLTFTCVICSAKYPTEKEYFQHLGNHLRSHETVECVFVGCTFKTNIYGTFFTHKSRKHNPHSLEDFKPDVTGEHQPLPSETDHLVSDDSDHENTSVNPPVDISNEIHQRIGSLLLKLESVHNVSGKCIDDLVEELHFIYTASAPIIRQLVDASLKKHNCAVEEDIVTELVEELCKSHPTSKALGVDGPFGSVYKRRQYFKKQLEFVEPVEYILDSQENLSFQYVPILPTLQHILTDKDIAHEVLKKRPSSSTRYESFQDGEYFKQNPFFAVEEPRIALILYVDDFEVCNPLGTSRKKHKITAVYWVLANVPSGLRSTLSAINLAILCKAVDVKRFGYHIVLEPLLKDLSVLEREGVFVACAGKNIKGTVYCVAADNLGAHSLGGLVENFTGPYVCRFCLGPQSEYSQKEVRFGEFPPRTEETHNLHLKTVEEDPTLTHFHGVKKACPLTKQLSHFSFVRGYPPDLLHDLFEGIVPSELAHCLNTFIKKKYFTLSELNDLIKQFPFKFTDDLDRPQSIPVSFASRCSIGGNAHENWALIRSLPLIIGSRIPSDDPAWQILMTLKDIVELSVSPIHSLESVAYLELKISEHRHRLQEVFPQLRLTPKHHFLEHYPALIGAFGPLVGLWTMRFEAKHRFFKRVVRFSSNFKNVLLSLSTKHQLMTAYNCQRDMAKPALIVSKVSSLPLEVLHVDIQESIKKLSPQLTSVQLSNTVTYHGTRYSAGMILPYGSTGGLPDFVEIIQMLILESSLYFIVKKLHAWYQEHLRSFLLESSREVSLVHNHSLQDVYPLAAYNLGGKRIVTLKRYICCTF